MLMAADRRRALDPASLAADSGIVLDAWQADLMQSTAPRVLILASRQVGKTEVCAQTLKVRYPAVRRRGSGPAEGIRTPTFRFEGPAS